MKLVIYPAIDDARLIAVREAAGNVPVVNCGSLEKAISEIGDATAFFGKLTPELLANASRLQWVQSPTASLEHYIFPELVQHPCVLTNMRGLFSDVITDHVFGYMLCAVRQLHRYLRQQWEHRWEPLGGEQERTSFATGPGQVSAIDRVHRRLADCSLGVVGVGAIGSEIVRRGVLCGMQVVGVDPVVTSVTNALPEVWPLERLPELLRDSDFVVIAAPHTPSTAHMFARAQFEQMRSDSWLINIGRGAIVNLTDLTAALIQGTIAGAALDVFEAEPLPAEHPLWSMENVILTPHIAAASTIVPQRHLETLLENVRRYVAGETLLNVADKQQWF